MMSKGFNTLAPTGFWRLWWITGREKCAFTIRLG